MMQLIIIKTKKEKQNDMFFFFIIEKKLNIRYLINIRIYIIYLIYLLFKKMYMNDKNLVSWDWKTIIIINEWVYEYYYNWELIDSGFDGIHYWNYDFIDIRKSNKNSEYETYNNINYICTFYYQWIFLWMGYSFNIYNTNWILYSFIDALSWEKLFFNENFYLVKKQAKIITQEEANNPTKNIIDVETWIDIPLLESN